MTTNTTQLDSAKIKRFQKFVERVKSSIKKLKGYEAEMKGLEEAMMPAYKRCSGEIQETVNKALKGVMKEWYLHHMSIVADILKYALGDDNLGNMDAVSELAEYCKENVDKEILEHLSTICEGHLSTKDLCNRIIGDTSRTPEHIIRAKKVDANRKVTALVGGLCSRVSSTL